MKKKVAIVAVIAAVAAGAAVALRKVADVFEDEDIDFEDMSFDEQPDVE